MILLGSNSNADAMACVDVQLFHSCNGAALLITRSHDCEYCHDSLLPLHGAAITALRSRDFTFGARLWFLDNILFACSYCVYSFRT